jgi:hypothetical protein
VIIGNYTQKMIAGRFEGDYMYIFWGIITAVLTILLEFIFLQGSFSLNSFTVGVVIPAGAWIDGLLCASGMYLYLKIKHKRVKIRHRICSVVIAFVTFGLIYLMSYSTTFVENGKVNHAFKGEHISNFSYNQTENYNFSDYLNLRLNNIRIISSHNGLIIGEYDMGLEFNKFLFLLQLLGFCIGGLTCGVIAIEGRDYCKKCKIDFITKHLYSVPEELFNEEFNAINKTFESKDSFKQYVGVQRNVGYNAPYYDVSLKYCASCKKAYIEYRYIYIKRCKKGEEVLAENKDKRNVIEAPYRII